MLYIAVKTGIYLDQNSTKHATTSHGKAINITPENKSTKFSALFETHEIPIKIISAYNRNTHFPNSQAKTTL